MDAEFAGMVSREQDMYDLAIYARPNQTITIVVESQGRICFGSHINDFKVTVFRKRMENWSMYNKQGIVFIPFLSSGKHIDMT